MTRVSDRTTRNPSSGARTRPERVQTGGQSTAEHAVGAGPSETAGRSADTPAQPSSANRRRVGRPITRLQTQLRAQAAALQQPAANDSPLNSRSDYLANWHAWAQEPGAATEMRDEAVRRMSAWLDERNPEVALRLNSLHLTSLPTLWPAGLRSLNVSFNLLSTLPNSLPAELERIDAFRSHLTSLPQNLPAGLHSLNVEGNLLMSLPTRLPAQLRVLNASFNHLTSLPEGLPGELEHLSVSYNRLRSLPIDLPASLMWLNIQHNLLTSLPADITNRLSQFRHMLWDHNPLTEPVRDHLDDFFNRPIHQGPHIFSVTNTTAPSAVVRPLPDAVVDWYEARDKAATHQTWTHLLNGLDPEQLTTLGVPQFSKFLDRLQNTVYSKINARDLAARQQFRQSTSQWLSHLATHPGLRAQTFLISQEASTTCEDRVSLFLNSMKKARVAADVEGGLYDTQLPELIHLARGMFRLDQLEVIARNKVATLHSAEEAIEVYLAYQVKLRQRLELPIDTPEMRYFGASDVTPDDLDQAERQVKLAETDEFIHYLSTDWQPWQAVLERLDPAAYGHAKDHLINTLSEDFSSLLTARLQPLQLENDPDAQRIQGLQLKTEITHEINGQLTRHFLAKQGLTHLLQEEAH